METMETDRDERSRRSTWQLQFSFRNDIDLLYESIPKPSKPRVPTEENRNTSWRQLVLPDTIDDLLGNTHAQDVLRNTPQSGKTNFIISGGEATGKHAFLRVLKAQLPGVIGPGLRCIFHSFDARQSLDKELMTKMEDAVRKMDSATTVAFLVIDNFEAVPVNVQQHYLLPFLAVANTKSVYAIVILRPDATKLPEQFKQRAVVVHLKPLDEMHVRTKLLQVCATLKIGYDRTGLEDLLKRSRSQLLPSLTKLQEVFVAYHYISSANVKKLFHGVKKKESDAESKPLPPPFPLSIVEMNEPLRRCKRCTLLPPCAHVTMHHLYDRIDRIRQLYPTRENEPQTPICPSYLRRGICSNVQSIGRCRYAHPRDLRAIDTSELVKRCRTHTLPLPCLHCDKIRQAKTELQREEDTISALQKEMITAKKTLVEKETERYIFVREHTKSVKWGAARREYDERLAIIDNNLRAAQQRVDDIAQDLWTRRAHTTALKDDTTRGRSKGLGKGNGRVEINSMSTAIKSA